MNLLAVDTTTKSCSVAAIQDVTTLAEFTFASNQTHSKHLMGMIQTVLNLSKLSVMELDGFVVTLGPGSFTGLRIGLSALKGLAAASGKPIVGVSTLEALATQFAFTNLPIYPLLDAKRGEVYFAGYRWQDGIIIQEIEEQAKPPVEAVRAMQSPCLLVGDGALFYQEPLKERLGSHASFVPETDNILRATSVARCGYTKLIEHSNMNNGQLVPHYIRQSYAEMALKEPK